MKGDLKKAKRLAIQMELLKSFAHQKTDHYEEMKVGNEWHIKSYNGGTKRWQVSIYSEVSYRNYKSFQDDREPKRRKENIKPHIPFERPTLESIKKMTETKETVDLPDDEINDEDPGPWTDRPEYDENGMPSE